MYGTKVEEHKMSTNFFWFTVMSSAMRTITITITTPSLLQRRRRRRWCRRYCRRRWCRRCCRRASLPFTAFTMNESTSNKRKQNNININNIINIINKQYPTSTNIKKKILRMTWMINNRKNIGRRRRIGRTISKDTLLDRMTKRKKMTKRKRKKGKTVQQTEWLTEWKEKDTVPFWTTRRTCCRPISRPIQSNPIQSSPVHPVVLIESSLSILHHHCHHHHYHHRPSSGIIESLLINVFWQYG